MTVYLVTYGEPRDCLATLGVAADPDTALRHANAKRKALRLRWLGAWEWWTDDGRRVAQRFAESADGWPGARREFGFRIEAREVLA